MSQTLTAPPPAHARPGKSAQERTRFFGLLAEFDDEHVLVEACKRIRDAGFSKWDAYTPYPVHGIDPAIGVRPTILPWIVFCVGAAGTLTGLTMQWWMNAVDYPFAVSGKPLFSLPAFIPIIFELTILFSAFAAVFGMLGLNKLPQLHNPLFRSERFRRATSDRFFIAIEARDPHFRESETRHLLEAAGSQHIERLEDGGSAKLPRGLINAAIILTLISWIPLALAARAWFATSSQPRIHLIQDMDNQPRFKTQQLNPIFADTRASRQPPPGTISRADEILLGQDEHFFFGTVDGQWATTLPPALMKGDIAALIARGQERYAIYCLPCHGADGSGYGPVRVRSEELETPLNVRGFNEEAVLARPLGHLFNTISNGFNTMPQYGDQIPVADRWAIVSYVRSLQRSWHATLEDIDDAAARSELERRRGAEE